MTGLLDRPVNLLLVDAGRNDGWHWHAPTDRYARVIVTVTDGAAKRLAARLATGWALPSPGPPAASTGEALDGLLALADQVFAVHSRPGPANLLLAHWLDEATTGHLATSRYVRNRARPAVHRCRVTRESDPYRLLLHPDHLPAAGDHASDLTEALARVEASPQPV